MPSTYTTSLSLTLPATGELSGTWGNTVNTGITALVDDSVAGTTSITMAAADYTLSTTQGATNEARRMFLTMTGTPGAARNVIVPAVSKLYFVYNNTTGGFAQTVKTASGSGVSVPNGARMVLYCNGTDVVTPVTAVNLNLPFSTFTGALGVANGGTGATTLTGLIKGNGTGAFTAAVSGTDYAPATSGTSILYGNGSGGFSNVSIGSGITFVGGTLSATGSGGTVTSVTASAPLASSGGTAPNISFTGTLAVANGGTGVTTSTGSGNNVLSTGPTLSGATLNGTTTFGGSVVPATNTVDSAGYAGIPANSQTANYTTIAGDANKAILHPISDNSPRTFTIDSNANVPYPVGTTIMFINMINTVTIAITSDTLYLANTGTTGPRSLGAFGIATAVKVSSTAWIISGNGLS